LTGKAPTTELTLASKQFKHSSDLKTIGVDEAGRGPLVGSVVAAAVILPPDFQLSGLTDSKKLSEKKRDSLYQQITEQCDWSVAEASSIEIDKINIVHNYLDSLEEVGKVLSFSSIVQLGEQLNDGKKLETLELGILYTKLPDTIKKEIIDPYISIEDNEARINLRIKDSKENLRRNELIKKINNDLENKLGFKKEEYKLAGVLILFNNLLQSLFKSQILTLGFVMVGIFTMFLVLFRNLTLSFIGVVPNFIAAFFILGIIGLLGIPLDMMTITIAAITIGIAVDNSIHYIYRF